MKRVIGIVSEGPTDQMAIRTVIDRLTGEKNIQPEQDARGEFGNGWKGVYRWCENNAELIPALFSQIMPRFDALIIHCFMTERIEEDNQQCSSKSHK